jgi:MFS family permease
MTTTGTSTAAPIGRTRWLRLIPVAVIVYVISFMDRTNIGFAFAGIGQELHIDKAQQGLGYLVLQVPGGHLAERWSAKKFVAIMIVAWGIFAILSGLVQSFGQLLVVRLLLGVAEGGIWPAILVLISHWFPTEERARAFGIWMINIPLSSIITAPLSGWILSFSDWRALFLIQGALPFVIALPLWLWLVADRPSQARWVGSAEREWIERSLAEDEKDAPAFAGYGEVFRSSIVWRLVLVYFLIQVGFYGLNLWLPTLLKGTTGGNSTLVGWLTAIPYVVAAVAMYLTARAADRNRRYGFHVLVSLVIGAAALVASVALGSLPVLSIALVSIAMAGALAYDGPFWASASLAVPVTLAGGAMGLVNALGNLGGFVGPYLGGYLQDLSGGSFLSTSIVLAVSMVLGGLVMVTLKGRANPGSSAAPREAASTGGTR